MKEFYTESSFENCLFSMFVMVFLLLSAVFMRLSVFTKCEEAKYTGIENPQWVSEF